MSDLFERFWRAGMRKCNKKKTRPIFDRIIKEQSDPEAFVDQLVSDIELRVLTKQFGFDKMHPTTYLNGERWEDEVTNDADNQRLDQTGRPSLIDRVKANSERPRSYGAGGSFGEKAMAENDRNVRAQVRQPIRRDAGGNVGIVLEGDYRQTDG